MASIDDLVQNLGDTVVEGDKVQLIPQGLTPIDGVVDYVSPHFLGVRSDDALYRFIHGFEGTTMVGHHLFQEGVNRMEAERSWRAWLSSLFDGTDATVFD